MALARLLEERMTFEIERHLERMAELEEEDRRNSSYTRHRMPACTHRRPATLLLPSFCCSVSAKRSGFEAQPCLPSRAISGSTFSGA